MRKIKTIQKDVNYRRIKIAEGNNITYDFSDYKTFKELFRDLYYRNMTINEEDKKQDKFDGSLVVLKIYPAKKEEHIEARNKLLNNAKSFYKGREKIIEGFKNGILPLNYDEEEEQEFSNKEEENNIRDNNGHLDYKKLNRLINLKGRDMNNELVRKHFQVQNLVSLIEKLKKSKNNAERNGIQANLIKSGLRELKEEIGDISEQEKTPKTQMK